MRIKELRRQVGATLGSDLLEEAKIVWVYLFVVRPGGVGTKTLALRVGLDEETVTEAIGVLKEAGLVARHGGVWKPGLYLRDKGEASDVPRPLRDAAQKILELYQEARGRAGVPRLFETRGASKDCEKLAEWLNANGVDATEYIKWGAERTKWMVKKGVKFPSTAVLAGDWLRGEWLNGDRTSTAAPGHAGKVYNTAAGLRQRLVSAGFDRARGFSKSDLRHIESWALDMVSLPDDFPEADPEFQGEIMWLRKHLGGDGANAATA